MEIVTNVDKVTYLQFQDGFDSNCSCIDTFFNPIFKKLYSLVNKPICVVSVFPNVVHANINDKLITWVSYSGEKHHQPCKKGLYDLHLIMEPCDLENNIIYVSVFSLYAYEYMAWKLLMYPRHFYIKKDLFCAYVISDRNSNYRNRFIDRLTAKKHVDSFGNYQNNVGYMLPRMYKYNQYGVLSKYKFIICFENAIKPYYLTEKLLRAYLTGAVPVYAGDINSLKWFNPKAFLYLDNDSDEAMDQLIDKMLYLDSNDEAYRSIHQETLLREKKIPYELSIEHIHECMEKIFANEKK